MSVEPIRKAAPILTEAEFIEWLTKRDEALIAMDEKYLLKMCGVPAEIRLSILHKTRYECTSIPSPFRHASGAWLRERGQHRLTGDELLPIGDLPE